MTITGRIYKITSAQTDNIYIGSTTKTLKQRLTEHKSDYKRFMNNPTHNKSGYEIVQFDDAVIELIEEKEFKDKKEMLFRERYYIEIYECVNKMIPIRTNEETKEIKKIFDKKYKMENKYKINAYANEKIKCECGHSYTRAHKAEHMKSKRHMKESEKVINITINITCQKVEIMKTE